jgi:hypothetical protein
MCPAGGCPSGWEVRRELSGQVIDSRKVYYATFGDDKPEMVDREIGFCCHGCAWAWAIEFHGLFGIIGDKARQHLINEHGLVHPPGEPAGNQSIACFKHFQWQAEMILDCIRPDIRGNIFASSLN